MRKIAIGFCRMCFVGAAVMLIVAAAPAATVYAMGPWGASLPSAAPQVPNERLELAWAREQMTQGG